LIVLSLEAKQSTTTKNKHMFKKYHLCPRLNHMLRSS